MYSHLRSIFDEALALTYKEMKKAHVKLTAFWNIHGDNVSLLVSEADVEKLLVSDGAFTTCEPELARVCSTRLGKALYEWAHAKVVNEKVAVIMDDLSQKLDDVEDLTAKFANAACAEAC